MSADPPPTVALRLNSGLEVQLPQDLSEALYRSRFYQLRTVPERLSVENRDRLRRIFADAGVPIRRHNEEIRSTQRQLGGSPGALETERQLDREFIQSRSASATLAYHQWDTIQRLLTGGASNDVALADIPRISTVDTMRNIMLINMPPQQTGTFQLQSTPRQTRISIADETPSFHFTPLPTTNTGRRLLTLSILTRAYIAAMRQTNNQADYEEEESFPTFTLSNLEPEEEESPTTSIFPTLEPARHKEMRVIIDRFMTARALQRGYCTFVELLSALPSEPTAADYIAYYLLYKANGVNHDLLRDKPMYWAVHRHLFTNYSNWSLQLNLDAAEMSGDPVQWQAIIYSRPCQTTREVYDDMIALETGAPAFFDKLREDYMVELQASIPLKDITADEVAHLKELYPTVDWQICPAIDEAKAILTKFNEITYAKQSYYLGIEGESIIRTDQLIQARADLEKLGLKGYCKDWSETVGKLHVPVDCQNTCDTLMQKLRKYRSSDVYYLEENNCTFGFTRPEWLSLCNSGKNPYTGQRFTYKVLSELQQLMNEENQMGTVHDGLLSLITTETVRKTVGVANYFRQLNWHNGAFGYNVINELDMGRQAYDNYYTPSTEFHTWTQYTARQVPAEEEEDDGIADLLTMLNNRPAGPDFTALYPTQVAQRVMRSIAETRPSAAQGRRSDNSARTVTGPLTTDPPISRRSANRMRRWNNRR